MPRAPRPLRHRPHADQERIEAEIEEEMRAQIQYNLDLGIIVNAEDDCFRYSTRELGFSAAGKGWAGTW